jgi:hypothetical protein
MSRLLSVEMALTIFVMSAAGCYVALTLRDLWRQYRRYRRLKKEGPSPGTPVYFVSKQDRAKDDTPVTKKTIKH